MEFNRIRLLIFSCFETTVKDHKNYVASINSCIGKSKVNLKLSGVANEMLQLNITLVE